MVTPPAIIRPGVVRVPHNGRSPGSGGGGPPPRRAAASRAAQSVADGRSFAPDGAWRHADDHFDRAERRIEYGYFHAYGSAEVEVPAGPVTIEVTRGLEYRPVRRTVEVKAGATHGEAVALERIADLPARGWWSGDLHVHMNYGGAYRATPETLVAMARAEDLHAVFNLIVNKEERIPDVAWFSGTLDPRSTPRGRSSAGPERRFEPGWWKSPEWWAQCSRHASFPRTAG